MQEKGNPQNKRKHPPGWKDSMEYLVPIEWGAFPTYEQEEELIKKVQALQEENRQKAAQEQAKK